MGDFLTTAEFNALTGQSVSTERGDALIDIAEAEVRTYCGWNITEETVTDQVVVPQGRSIFLPTLYLTAVSEIVEGGTTLTVGTHYAWGVDGEIRRWTAYWSPLWESVVVSYVHGYPTGSSELLVVKQVVASIVSRRLEGTSDRSTGFQVGGWSESFAAPPQVPSGLLYAEQGALTPFKLPVGP